VPAIEWKGFKVMDGKVELGELKIDSDRLKVTTKPAEEVELNGKRVSTFNIYLHNTRPIPTAGISGLSLPIGLTNDGLPAGLESDGLCGSDGSLLSLGISIEKLFGKISPPPHIMGYVLRLPSYVSR